MHPTYCMHPTCWASLQRNHTLSLAHNNMEPRHLIHSALTCPSGRNAQHLKWRHPFVPATQQYISSSNNNRSAKHWADHWWNAGWLKNTVRLHSFIPEIGSHPPGIALSRTGKERLNRLRTGIRRFCSCCAYTNGIWPLLHLGSVTWKNRPPTMLSFTVQFTDLSVECMVWCFWMTRELNGCSTPAPRCSAA